MFYTEDLTEAGSLAESAFEFMLRHGLQPVPDNFALCYCYMANSIPGLTREVKQLLAADRPLTEEIAEKLYCRHFRLDADVGDFASTGERVSASVNQVIRSLAESGARAGEYRDKLDGLSGQIGDGEQEIGASVRRILAETEQLAKRNKRLEAELSEASREIHQLQANLEEVAREAITDPLTGLANRKHFDAALQATAQAAKEKGEPFCLLMADVDHFKSFNDRFGHRVGDQVLKLVARSLNATLSGERISARFGGEEFAVILQGTELSEAVSRAQAFRRSLAEREVTDRKSGTNYGQVTISIGVARHRTEDTPSSLIGRADQALYEAKRSGRNRVVDETALTQALGSDAAA